MTTLLLDASVLLARDAEADAPPPASLVLRVPGPGTSSDRLAMAPFAETVVRPAKRSLVDDDWPPPPLAPGPAGAVAGEEDGGGKTGTSILTP